MDQLAPVHAADGAPVTLPEPRLPRAIAVRRMRPSDEAFVYRSWLKACRRCARHETLPSAVYYGDVHDQIERLIAAPVVSVSLAVDPGDDDVLVGFLCTELIGGEPRVVHFAYTKSDDRRRGVFRGLARAAGLDLRRPFFYTAHPPTASDVVRAFPQAIYRRDILALAR
jgi:hypothetical protein